MAQYRISIYSGPQHNPYETLSVIALLLGLPNVDALNANRSKETAGTITCLFSSVRGSLVEGIKKTKGVHTVEPI